MQLRFFLLGAVTLLTLSSCGTRDAKVQAQASSPTPTQAISVERSPAAPDEVAQDGEVPDYPDDDYAANEQAYDQGDQSGGQQSGPQGASLTVGQILPLVQMTMQSVGQRLEMANTTYSMAQQNGDQAAMQSLQGQIAMHQQFYSELQAVAQNPQAYTDPQSFATLNARINEYDYRFKTGDQRPTDQIQAELAQYTAQVNWKASTPEGHAAFQADLNNDARQSAAFTDNMTRGHNDRMNAIQSQGDARNAAWARDQRVSDERQAQAVHSINDQYEYADPNNGQRYWVPGQAQNPYVTNPDGSQTQLEQYAPSSNY